MNFSYIASQMVIETSYTTLHLNLKAHFMLIPVFVYRITMILKCQCVCEFLVLHDWTKFLEQNLEKVVMKFCSLSDILCSCKSAVEIVEPGAYCHTFQFLVNIFQAMLILCILLADTLNSCLQLLPKKNTLTFCDNMPKL